LEGENDAAKTGSKNPFSDIGCPKFPLLYRGIFLRRLKASFVISLSPASVMVKYQIEVVNSMPLANETSSDALILFLASKLRKPVLSRQSIRGRVFFCLIQFYFTGSRALAAAGFSSKKARITLARL
jgi:hypothetical protein